MRVDIWFTLIRSNNRQSINSERREVSFTTNDVCVLGLAHIKAKENN